MLDRLGGRALRRAATPARCCTTSSRGAVAGRRRSASCGSTCSTPRKGDVWLRRVGLELVVRVDGREAHDHPFTRARAPTRPSSASFSDDWLFVEAFFVAEANPLSEVRSQSRRRLRRRRPTRTPRPTPPRGKHAGKSRCRPHRLRGRADTNASAPRSPASQTGTRAAGVCSAASGAARGRAPACGRRARAARRASALIESSMARLEQEPEQARRGARTSPSTDPA